MTTRAFPETIRSWDGKCINPDLIRILAPFVPVPPKTPVIFDEAGLEAATSIGPYQQGRTVRVSCEVRAGEKKQPLYLHDNLHVTRPFNKMCPVALLAK